MTHRTTLTTEEARLLAELSQRTINQNEAVNVPSRQYAAMTAVWDLPFTLMDGTVGMRAAGVKYLQQNPKERDDDYQVRLSRTVLTNAFKKTVVNLSSKPFTKPATLSDGMDEELRGWLETDVDREESDINQFAMQVLQDALVAGKSHILAEFPRVQDEEGTILTLADVRERGLRPYLSHIKARNVIGWKSDIIDGLEVLQQVRFREWSNMNTGRFTEIRVKRVRVLFPGSFELWQQDPRTQQWLLIDAAPTQLSFIPLTTFYTDRKGFLTSEPPLRDLADLNQAHWESTSDQRHILHVARVPILFGKGLGSGPDPEGTPQEVIVSPNSLVHSDNPNSDLRYVEHAGSAIASGQTDLDKLLEKMEAFSMQLLIPRTGNQTATASAIDAAAAQSDLQRMVTDLESAIGQAIGNMAMLGNIPEDQVGTVEFFDDFGIKVGSTEEAELLLRMSTTGKLTTKTLLQEIKRRGLVSDDFDPEAEALIANDEASTLLTFGAPTIGQE